MTGRHHPTAPPDPAMLAPHPRTACERDRCGMAPWRIEDQPSYRSGYLAGYAAAVARTPEHCPDCAGGLYCLGVTAPRADGPA